MKQSLAWCICTVCHEVFKTSAGFDKHRVGDYQDVVYNAAGKSIGWTAPKNPRRCLSSDEMAAVGMSKNYKGQWITAVYDPRAHEEGEDE